MALAATRPAIAAQPVRPAAPAARAPEGPAAARPADARALIAPLDEGSQLGRWTVTKLLPFADGAVSVVMVDSEGASFQLDICARDDSEGALMPPGRTDRFDVFLSNEGEGRTASFEDHGLAAMAVSDVIRGNEVLLDASAFLTLRQRLATSGHRIQRHV